MSTGFATCSSCNAENCPFTSPADEHEPCIFADTLDAVEYGLLIGQPSTSEYVYMNAYAREVHQHFTEQLRIDNLLHSLSHIRRTSTVLGSPASPVLFSRQVLRRAGKVIGISTYLPGNDSLVVTLKSLGKDIAEAPEATESISEMDTIIRIFSQLRHEIGNPLNSIKMALQVLRKNIDTFSADKTQSYIERTINEVARLEKLLESMRVFSRRSSLHISEFDMKALLDNFALLVADECRDARMEVRVDVAPDARHIKGDSAAFQQVLHNLLRNAIQARKTDSGAVAISVKQGRRPQTVHISFEDDGNGIPAHNLSMIFKPMFTTKPDGTGLGLATVERLMWRMGGTISVTSEEDKFTQFLLTLPSGASQ